MLRVYQSDSGSGLGILGLASGDNYLLDRSLRPGGMV